jgi:hypothetical protein
MGGQACVFYGAAEFTAISAAGMLSRMRRAAQLYCGASPSDGNQKTDFRAPVNLSSVRLIRMNHIVS